jgi:type II secretory pathway component PulK
MKKRRGSILVVVLFAMAVLSLLAMSFAYRAALEGRSARHRAVMVQLKAQAASAVAIALGRLAENVNNFDHPSEPWRAHGPLVSEDWLDAWVPEQVSEAAAYSADYQVVDEDGKLNVNYASSVSLEKLGMSQGQIAGLFDWMDGDNNPQTDGAENEFYMSRARPYRCKNGPMEVLDEMLLVRGFGPLDCLGEDANHNRALDNNENDGTESYPPDNADGRLRLGYADLLTCIGEGRINLNTASAAVLETLPLSEGAARQIEQFLECGDASRGSLEEHAFRSEADIDQLQGLTEADKGVLKGIAVYKSSHFRIFAQAIHRPTGLACRLEVLVQMNDQQARVLQWKAGE